MSRRRPVVVLVAVLFLSAAATVMAQVEGGAEEPAVVPTPTPAPAPTPIPAANIPGRAAADAMVARQAVAGADPDLTSIQQRLAIDRARLQALGEETTRRIALPGPAQMIGDVETATVRVSGRLTGQLNALESRTDSLDATLGDLQERIALWRLTRDEQPQAALPPALTRQIGEILTTLVEAENEVRSARDAVLDVQTDVAQHKMAADELIARQRAEIASRTRGLLVQDSPPLWNALAGIDEGEEARQQLDQLARDHRETLKSYVTEHRDVAPIWALLWLVLVLVMVTLRRRAEALVQQDRSLETAVALLSRPAATALALTSVIRAVLEPRAPASWSSIVGLVVAFAFLRVLSVLLPPSLRPGAVLLVLLLVLRGAVHLTPPGFALNRLALLALAGGGIALCLWSLRTLRGGTKHLAPAWHRRVRLASRASLLLFVVGAVADLLGGVALASLLLIGTTQAILAAVGLALTALILRSMVQVVLLTDAARRVGITPTHSETVRSTTFRVIDALAVVAWGVSVLRAFFLLEPLLDGLRRGLDWTVAIGAFSFEPSDVVIFAFVIWLSFKLAAVIEFVLNLDLVPRAGLPRGVPEAISRVARYALIGLGAVIASAAAGLDVSRVAIIVGALGVGVGFGLQNIVNNFVSGLILLFERPIRVGDTLELGGTGGVVQKIGMRASVVRTWDEAELIVPNARLVSEDVVNWTLSHDRRRIVIPFGVSYGHDPERVAELIVQVARSSRDVYERPEPMCLFAGFGDSSLDFKLYAWTAAGDFLRVASDLRIAIAHRLAEAGVEIPFPQRDLHLRTVDGQVTVRAPDPKGPDDPGSD